MKRAILIAVPALLFLTFARQTPAQLASSVWPKFHRDISNTGQGAYGGTGSDLTWTYAAGAAIKSAPVVGADGTAYFTCDNGRLYAIGGDGVKRWDYYCNCLGSGSPVVASDGTIFVGSADKYLHAVKADGTLKWKKLLTARIDSSPTIASDGTVYFGCNEGTIYAFTSTGTQKWTYKAEEPLALRRWVPTRSTSVARTAVSTP